MMHKFNFLDPNRVTFRFQAGAAPLHRIGLPETPCHYRYVGYIKHRDRNLPRGCCDVSLEHIRIPIKQCEVAGDTVPKRC